MTFFTVVIRGLLRRPLRTGFTLAGISIGIAAVVALVGMARGFQKGWQVGLKARGTDIVVNNRTGGADAETIRCVYSRSDRQAS